VLVAVASLIAYPTAQITGGDQEAIYIVMVKDFLGPGLKGLLFVSFLAAFMSTLSTQLNWGASYLMNDIYKRFIKRNESEAHYIFVSRICTLVLTLLAGYFAYHINNIGKAWIFLWAMSAGIGLVLILRWFWWRINAWSEISALAASLITMLLLSLYTKIINVPLELKHQIIVIPVSIISWLLVTYLTKPEPDETLANFYKKIRPWGFWSPAAKANPGVERALFLPVVVNWLLGVSFIFFLMIGIGKLLLGQTMLGAVMVLISVCSGVAIYVRMRTDF
jgi:Na+/proline symporter